MGKAARKQTGTTLPPMLQQYLEYKDEYPDCLVLIQVGDFYEAFFDDAELLAKTLNITLTSRSKNSDNPVPMAGVPIAVVDAYMERLVDAGFSVTLVSQYGDTSGKGMVKRKVDRVLTPGIRIAGNAEGSTESVGPVVALMSNSAVFREARQPIAFAFASSTVQSGRIQVQEVHAQEQLFEQLGRLQPSEIIFPSRIQGKTLDRRSNLVRSIERNFPAAVVKLREPRDESSRDLPSIPGFSVQSTLVKRSVRLLCDFIDETLIANEVSFSSIDTIESSALLAIDISTRANLDLLRHGKTGAVEGSLLHIMNGCRTPGGQRLLKSWISAPLTSEPDILQRLDAVQACIDMVSERVFLGDQLQYIGDLERYAARIELELILPTEMAGLRNALEVIPGIFDHLRKHAPQSVLIQDLIEQSPDIQSPLIVLQRALVEQPPALLKDGGFIRDGYDPDLDRARIAKREGKAWLASLEASLKEETGISSLKIKHNNVLGYFIEVTKANLSKVPEDFVKKQSTTNAGRFFTTKLKEIEQEVVSAVDDVRSRETELLLVLRKELVSWVTAIRQVASVVSTIDILCGFADVSEQYDYRRPEICQERCLHIVAGKHPVVERVLRGGFVPNDCTLDADSEELPHALILTGPNMGGKSTYLRQVALLTIMAQTGCFIPVQEARIGIVDRLFARIGASDDLLEGESTFMVEMREAAHIIRHAGPQSLILVDEIGRGTATLDGLSLARAIFEWIVNHLQSRVIFATHFHELTLLASQYAQVENICVASVQKGASVVFTHTIERGAANRSYGLQVASLAGLPDGLLEHARQFFVDYAEEGAHGTSAQLSLFAAEQQRAEESVPEVDSLREELLAVQPDNVTPREALQILYTLKDLAAQTI